MPLGSRLSDTASRIAPYRRRGHKALRCAAPTATLLLGAALAALALVPAHAAPPDPVPEPSIRMESRSALHMSAWRHRQDTPWTRQRLTQETFLGTHARTGRPLHSTLLLRSTVDAALAARPDHPLLQERQLANDLMLAYVQWGSASTVQLRLGRHTLAGTRGLRLIDGASIERAASSGWTLRAALGLSPHSAALGINPFDHEVGLDIDARGRPQDQATLAYLGAAYTGRQAGVSIAWESTRPLSPSTLYDHSVAGDLWWRTGSTLTLGSRAHARLDQGALDNAEVEARVRTSSTTLVRASAGYDVSLFPTDSLFVIFPLSGQGRTQLDATWSEGTTLWMVATHAAWDASYASHELPWPDRWDPAARVGGSLRWRRHDPAITLGAFFSAEQGASGHQTRLLMSAATPRLSWADRLDLHVSLMRGHHRGVTTRSVATVAAAASRVQWALGGWGRVELYQSVALDERWWLDYRTVALLDLALPGARP